MKTLYKTFKFVLGVFLLAVIAVSCLPEEETMGDAGQTLVKLHPSYFSKIFLAPVATSQSMAVVEVRRDVPSEAALNSTTSVVLKFDKDTAIIKKYNSMEGTNYILLPNTLYTANPATAADGSLTINFGAGEYVKSIMITVPNVFNFDFSKKYALAYKMISITGTGINSEASNDTAIVEIAAQNIYEGWYKAIGWRNHPSLGELPVDVDKYLYTVNQYTVRTYTGDYSPYNLYVTYDPLAPADHNVTISSPDATLYDHIPGNVIRGIDGGWNHYDPVAKKYYLYYYYNSTAPRIIHEQFTKK